ncbi:MAG: acetate--CoA ligase alpha subunit [Nanobdellota archaeon]
MNESLRKTFNPDTIAVVGASNKHGSVGNSIIKNILGKFPGIVYPVNPKRKSIMGVKAYESLSKIPDNIDLVIVATPSHTVPSIVKEAGKKKVKGMVIITAGFKEAGEEGKQLFNQVIEIANKNNIKIIGPNCLGFLRPKNSLNASFATKMALPGKIAFISQSGALCTAILDWSVQYNVGFSHFVSLGSMANVGFESMLEYLKEDPETEAVIIYMESLSNPAEFLKAASSITKEKPVIVLKVGRSSAGAKAALSHTGSLAGNDAVYDAAFKRAGISRIYDSQSLYNCAQVLSRQPFPKNNRLAIITNAGGPGVIATDALMQQGGRVAELSPSTLKKLDSFLPSHWSHGNPVDVLGDADPQRYQKAVNICLKDKNVDGIMVILTPQSMTEPMKIAKSIIEIYKKYPKKPIFGVWMGEQDVELGKKSLEKGNIPVYNVPEDAVRVFMSMYGYTKNKEKANKKTPYKHTPHKNRTKNKRLINKILSEGRNSMTETEAKWFISNYDIPTTRFSIARTAMEVWRIASTLSFPIVMKISSPDIMHKTDVGGVKANINTPEQARQTYEKIINNVKNKAPDARIEGVLIEEMISKKFELLIGSKKDELFGPTIVFGKGGVTVELEKDTNLTLPPINKEQAKSLMEKTKIYNLLKGYRGIKGVNINKLQDILYKFSKLLIDFPELKEVDINPFSVDENGGAVLDAKIILDDKVNKNQKQLEHLAIQK